MFEEGQAYYFRGNQWAYLGRVKSVAAGFIELVEASWVADDGRYGEALSRGVPRINELEKIPPQCEPYLIAMNQISDAAKWVHELPTESK